MIQELKTYNRISYTKTHLTGETHEELIKAGEEWLRHSERISAKMKGANLHPVSGRIETTVASYGENVLVLQIGYDSFTNFEGGFLIEAYTKDGLRTTSLLEHCMNTERPPLPITQITPNEVIIHRSIPTVHQSLSEINFIVNEGMLDGRRFTAFYTEVNHPKFLRREVYCGYIEVEGKFKQTEWGGLKVLRSLLHRLG